MKSEETREESSQGVYHAGRSRRRPPPPTPGWEEGRTPHNLGAPTLIQEDVNPGISVEESEVVSLAERSGWEYGTVTRACANLGR
jgi:hypothetical protein